MVTYLKFFIRLLNRHIGDGIPNFFPDQCVDRKKRLPTTMRNCGLFLIFKFGAGFEKCREYFSAFPQLISESTIKKKKKEKKRKAVEFRLEKI